MGEKVVRFTVYIAKSKGILLVSGDKILSLKGIVINVFLFV